MYVYIYIYTYVLYSTCHVYLFWYVPGRIPGPAFSHFAESSPWDGGLVANVATWTAGLPPQRDTNSYFW